MAGHPCAWIIYLESLGDGSTNEEAVVEPVVILARPREIGRLPRGRFLEQIRSRLLTAQSISEITTHDEAITEILDGHSLLLTNGIKTALSIETRGFPGRGVQEQAVEVATRGFPEYLPATVLGFSAWDWCRHYVSRRIAQIVRHSVSEPVHSGTRPETDRGILVGTTTVWALPASG